MITVGLDFGTHQTKVCAEYKEGAELTYTFFTFPDTAGEQQYTLPSIIGVGTDGLLSYGYLPYNYEGRILRYFKQSALLTTSTGKQQVNAMFFSTWYLAYILFDLEERYGQMFTIQMGVPTDSSHIEQSKQIATRIISSAYRLVEEVFANDKEAFLATPMKELVNKTEIVPYSQETKDDYKFLVFPEAYACLKPLISQGKLATGMSLMVDIGGGTTDISFFTLGANQPMVYYFASIDKGLNFLTQIGFDKDDRRKDSNVISESEIIYSRRVIYENEIDQERIKLLDMLRNEFRKQSDFDMHKLWRSLENRPIIYAGGGSTFDILRKGYYEFTDIISVSQREWNHKAVVDMHIIDGKKLCPILQTAYGLAISSASDDIEICSIKEMFPKKDSSHDSEQQYERYAYNDWDAIK